MEFEDVIKAIGSIILSLIIVALPVLCGLSFGFNWPSLIKFLFTLITFSEAVILWAVIWGSLN